ncbi:site-specific integrase [Pseudorhodobacter turbinis]|uniref:Site-specific integrase n=1 Tax=Pseudorhodobacter turbinis TaxID=2500533 RepID=A0A4P8EHC7_9RHOB|nr:site-specific integrase [Pseudorhodobacter turbinis]QCO56297.1 site-specific integrase [Pseudorhodobacter turbinis]
MKYVQQVRGKWIVRVTVPPELRAIIGQRELVERDLPSDTRTREKMAHGILNRFFATIDKAREIFETRKNSPPIALSDAAKRHYSVTIAQDELKRASMPTPTDIQSEKDRALDMLAQEQREHRQTATSVINATTGFELMAGARSFDHNNRVRRLTALRASFRTGETRWIEPAVQQYIKDNHYDVQPDTRAWRDLADAFARAEIEALERTLERDRGNFSGCASDPLLTAPATEPDINSPVDTLDGKSMLLSEALSAFHNERTAGGHSLAAKTMGEHRNAVRMFKEFIGADIAVDAITKKHLIEYKNALIKTPNRYTMRFPGLTLPEAIKANAKRPEPFSTLASKTVNMKWLSHLSGILNWAQENGHIEFNPAKGVRVDTGRKTHHEPSRLAFTKSELYEIFGHSMFADRSAYGLKQWALLIMLYTGVRNSSEMARMKLEYIYIEQGIPVFDLADASKNQGSKRLVPIHNDLVRLGFLDHVEALKKRGETLLFPEWAQRPDKVNDWFNDVYLVSLGLKTKKKVFYCFRHTLATELARAGVPRELSKMISGHAPQEVASVYIQASPIKLMATELNKVKFDLPIPGL